MFIAPNIQVEDWHQLKLDNPDNPDWKTATNILDCRIKEHYLEPVNFLIQSEEKIPPIERKFGFTILAIDCFLVETLGAFKKGLEKTDFKSTATFSEFLAESIEFNEYLNLKLAERFFYDFRCGILHQAEVAGNSKVWSIGPLIQNLRTHLIVNRNEFHHRLSKAFNRYIEELTNPLNIELRANFRKKMDFIARS